MTGKTFKFYQIPNGPTNICLYEQMTGKLLNSIKYQIAR